METIEDLKSYFADFLADMNSKNEIEYQAYSEIFDYGMELIERAGRLHEKNIK